MNKKVLAIDVGGSKIAYGIFDTKGKVGEIEKITLEKWEATEVIRHVKFLIKTYQSQVSAVGLGFPGIVNIDTGEIIYDEKSQKYEANWEFEVPVAIDNDANLAAVGEKWMGATQEVNNFVFIVLGDGIGSGIILDGHLYRGSHYASGEIKEIITNSDTTLDNISGHNFPGEFSEKDKASISYICEQLAHGIQSISALLDPTVIVIGGTRGVKLWPLIKDQLTDQIRHLNILIEHSSLGSEASLYGAAKVALEKAQEKVGV
jgi:predicted NBD/HSP70 family sugar kinase